MNNDLKDTILAIQRDVARIADEGRVCRALDHVGQIIRDAQQPLMTINQPHAANTPGNLMHELDCARDQRDMAIKERDAIDREVVDLRKRLQRREDDLKEIGDIIDKALGSTDADESYADALREFVKRYRRLEAAYNELYAEHHAKPSNPSDGETVNF